MRDCLWKRTLCPAIIPSHSNSFPQWPADTKDRCASTAGKSNCNMQIYMMYYSLDE